MSTVINAVRSTCQPIFHIPHAWDHRTCVFTSGGPAPLTAGHYCHDPADPESLASGFSIGMTVRYTIEWKEAYADKNSSETKAKKELLRANVSILGKFST